MLKSTASAGKWKRARYQLLSTPLLGDASISQATAPKNGGVTKDAVTSVRIMRRPGIFVRATIQPSGAATMQHTIATLTAITRVMRNGLTIAGSVTSWTMLTMLAPPASLVNARTTR